MNFNTRSIFSIIGGLIAMILTGLLLFPLLRMIIAAHFSLVEKDDTMDKFIVTTATFIWTAIAGFSGGISTAMIAASRNIFHSLLTGLTACIIVFIFIIIRASTVEWSSLFFGITLLLLSVIGGMVQRTLFLKKHETV